jgi:asparagine synthase (glutamine-hydrolysing)
MCGIVAMFSRRGPINEILLEQATYSLKHRGPESQRCWISPDQRVGLGHARLSIIDLTTGDQPIANEDESLRIVVNGEFYGYEETQKELERDGHKLRTHSDSEIALHLYEKLGTQCLQRLRGEFAFVLWDSINNTIFAARDRFGIKPLFFAQRDDTIYLASEAKALFAAGVPARWDCESVYNSAGISGQNRTLFDGVFQIPPGHFMLATEKDIQVTRYWDFDYPREVADTPQRCDKEYEEEFTSVFEEAVKLRLRADVPVACYLSGGIDSCAVLALASRHHQGPLRAFTITFDHEEYNEDKVAKEMAMRVGADFCPVLARSDDLADHFSDAIAQAETLAVNTHGVAKYLLSRAVREAQFKVVLTGEGSDEILGGYMHFRRDMQSANTDAHPAEGTASSLPPTYGSETSDGYSPLLNGKEFSLGVARKLLGFVPNWMEIAWDISTTMHSVQSDRFIAEGKNHDGFRNFFIDLDIPGQLTGRHPLHQSLYLWSKTRLPNYLLTVLGDRMEMGNSVEGRLPFLDHHVVEMARSLPVSQKIRGGTHKYILRQAMRETITPTVFRRPKQPFWSPPASLNPSGRFNTLMQDLLRGPVLRSMPFFDQPKVVRMLDALPKVDQMAHITNEQVLMMVLSACVLQDRYRMSA